MIKHICFDLDGTLAIQSPEFKIVRDELKYKTFAKVIGKDVDEDLKKQFDDLYKKYGSISSIFTKEFGKESDFWLQHFEILDKEKYYLPNEKIIETIKKLKEKFSLSVFTNSKLKGAKKTLNYIKIDEDNFDFILSGDDISERKPALDGYKKVIELTGLKPEEILYIGDRVEADIIPAKKVGMKTGLVWKNSMEADFSFINFEEIIEKLYEIIEIKLETNKEKIKNILDYYANFWKEEYGLDSILGEEAFNNEKFKIFSINIGEEFIGSGMFEKISESKYEMRSIAIKKEFRGKGYGKKLIEFIERFAKKQKIESIITLAINKAKGFYKKLGYKEIKPWSEKVEKILKFLEKDGNPTTPMEKKIKHNLNI